MHSEAVYELTPHSEDVLKFLGESLDRNLGFVGTESRLKRIIETLSDIVVRGSSDRSRRLDHLSPNENCSTARFPRSNRARQFRPTARPQFASALRRPFPISPRCKEIFAPSKSVSKRSRENVQKKQAEVDGSRGDILGFALAAEDSLKQQDQGVSFDEFVRLVLSPSKQDQFETIVARLDEIEVLVEQVEGMRRIRGMIGSLSDEAQKVLGTTRRLSSTLRRLLDSRVKSARLRLAAVLREIRGAAVRLAEDPPRDTVGIEILSELDLLNISERTVLDGTRAVRSTGIERASIRRRRSSNRLPPFRRLATARLGRDEAKYREHAPRGPSSCRLPTYWRRIRRTAEPSRSSAMCRSLTTAAMKSTIGSPKRFGSLPRAYELPGVVFLSDRLKSLVHGLQAGDNP